jgi:hypothetical protein
MKIIFKPKLFKNIIQNIKFVNYTSLVRNNEGNWVFKKDLNEEIEINKIENIKIEEKLSKDKPRKEILSENIEKKIVKKKYVLKIIILLFISAFSLEILTSKEDIPIELKIIRLWNSILKNIGQQVHVLEEEIKKI